MMITFVSQYEKKACTRWGPDAFADKIDGNTWQIAITQEGLSKTTSKNTVVSYHGIRSRSITKLVWVEDNRDRLTSKIGADKNIIESFLDSMLEIEHNGPCLAGENGIRWIVGRSDGF